MNAFLGGAELVVETTLSPLAMRELVDALALELTEFAFQREKVLEKLDVRAARRARRAATELRSFMRSALESGHADESAVSPILEECHLILSGATTAESELLPSVATSPVSEVRRITRKMQATAPTIAPMYGEDEPTLPGHRRAALVSLVDEDDDDDKTAAGLPDEVVSQYLREVCRATG